MRRSGGDWCGVLGSSGSPFIRRRGGAEAARLRRWGKGWWPTAIDGGGAREGAFAGGEGGKAVVGVHTGAFMALGGERGRVGYRGGRRCGRPWLENGAARGGGRS
jgi:hypothetical protein